MAHREGKGQGRLGGRGVSTLTVVAAFGLWTGLAVVQAETSFIAPPQVPLPPKAPVPMTKKPQESDSAVQRERERADAERRKREEAEKRLEDAKERLRKAENEADKLRVADQARQAA